MHALLPYRTVSLAAAALMSALAVYGVAGAPAPQSVGLPEALIAGALLLAIGVVRPLWLGSFYILRAPGLRPMEAGACLALLLAVWPGLLTGLGQGWPPGEMARDLLPFAFLFLPVLVQGRTEAETASLLQAVAWGLAGVGLAYALRWWVGVDASLHSIGGAALVEKPPFLLKSAALPFASVWLFLRGLDRLQAARGLHDYLFGPLLILACLICLGALAGAVHRAGLVLAGMAILIALFRRFGGSVRPWLVTGLILFAFVMLWGEAVQVSASLAMQKTRAVGVNNRAGEMLAVMQQVTATPLSFLFGYGWGGVVRSPAAGGLPISYTHNFLTYILLKAGVVGLLGVTAYGAALLARLPSAWRARPELVLALMPSLIHGLMLHTSYKYLCFGMVLLLLRLASDVSNKRAD